MGSATEAARGATREAEGTAPDEGPDPVSFERRVGTAESDPDGDELADDEPPRDDPAAEPPDPLLGVTLGDGYRLLDRLGSGGMGAVYEAETGEGQRLALKVILPERASHNPRAARRFLREARALTELDHPNVVRVLDAGVDADQNIAFIAMELLAGQDLGRLLARQGPLEPACAARLFCEACGGLAAAHDRGMVHRDVKPSNLFLHELPSGIVQPKLCDFGAAKWSAAQGGHQSTEDLTRTGNVVGSPLYMSPEQALGTEELDPRTDIWSLGVSLYCALTGRAPWRGTRTLAELFVSICTAPVPHVQDAAPWIPAGLAEVVHRALRRKPDERFASMRELEQALEPFAIRGPVAMTMLAEVSSSTRAHVAMRAVGPETATTEAAALSHTVAELPVRKIDRARTARRLGLGAVVAVVTALGWQWGSGGGLGSSLGSTAGGAVRGAQIRAAALPSRETARQRGHVAIAPSDATVTVDGVPRELVDGELVLAGDPGDQFDVVVTSGATASTTRVVLTKLGTAAPDRIDLGAAAPSAPAASGPSDPARRGDSAPKRRAGEEQGPLGGPAGTSAPSAPHPAAAEPLAPIESW